MDIMMQSYLYDKTTFLYAGQITDWNGVQPAGNNAVTRTEPGAGLYNPKYIPDSNTWVEGDPAGKLLLLKNNKIEELFTEGERRAKLVNEALSIPLIQWTAEILLSVVAASRSLTANVLLVRDIRSAALAARTVINNYTTEAEVAAYNVVTGPAWP